MNICIGAKVISQDGVEIGKVKSIILERHREVTHIVVHKGILLPYDTLITTGMAQGNTNGDLIIQIASGDVDQLPKYDESLFHTGPAGSEEVAETPDGRQFGVSEPPDRAQQLRQAIHFEPGSVEITNATQVEALDGKLGSVRCIQVDQYKYHLTYLVVDRGGPQKNEVSIPSVWVYKVGGDKITLSVPLQHAINGPRPPAGPYIPVEPQEEEELHQEG